jgi:hypothetical protein
VGDRSPARSRLLGTATRLFYTEGHFVMLRDGAMAAGSLADPDKVCRTLLRGVEGLLNYRDARVARQPAESADDRRPTSIYR